MTICGVNLTVLMWGYVNHVQLTCTYFARIYLCLILGILCMSLASPAYYGGTHFFLFVATVTFIGTLIWVFIYLLGVREALTVPIDWILTELVNTGICTIFYILAFIIQLIVSASIASAYHHRGTYIAAGVFGLFNAGVYAFATYLLYLEWKSSRSTN